MKKNTTCWTYQQLILGAKYCIWVPLFYKNSYSFQVRKLLFADQLYILIFNNLWKIPPVEFYCYFWGQNIAFLWIGSNYQFRVYKWIMDILFTQKKTRFAVTLTAFPLVYFLMKDKFIIIKAFKWYKKTDEMQVDNLKFPVKANDSC